MKTITEQLSTYKSVHLNHNNIKTHFIGVPLIIWAVALLMSTVSFEVEIAGQANINLSLVAIVALLILFYYFILDVSIALVAVLFFGPIVYSVNYFSAHEYNVYIALVVFIIGWIIQFVGHHFEKAKPAFIDDLNQLAIGPLFLAAEVYFALGMNKTLNKEVTELAIEKREAMKVS